MRILLPLLVAAAVLAPPAPAGAQSAVGLTSANDRAACAGWGEAVPETESRSAFVCFGTGQGAAHLFGGENDPFVYNGGFLFFEEMICDAHGLCIAAFGAAEIPVEDVDIDPILQTATLDTEIDGCAFRTVLDAGDSAPAPFVAPLADLDPGPGLVAVAGAFAAVAREAAAGDFELCSTLYPAAENRWGEILTITGAEVFITD